MKNRNLFIYGTLRGGAGHEMYQVLAKNAIFVAEAIVAGELYSLGLYSGLVPRGDTVSLVKGELYQIRSEALESTFEVLDEYEGLGPQNPLPHQYRRELVSAVLSDGRQLQAWAYVLNQPPKGLLRIGSGGIAEWPDSA